MPLVEIFAPVMLRKLVLQLQDRFSREMLEGLSSHSDGAWIHIDSSVDGEPQGNWRWRRSCKLDPSFSSPPPKRPEELARRLLRNNAAYIVYYRAGVSQDKLQPVLLL